MRCLVSLLLVFSSLLISTAQEANISVTVDKYPNSPVILGYYYNKQMLVKDTVYTDSNCKAVFQQNQKYPEGVYIVYIPKKSYFDIILGEEQNLTIKCDTSADMVAHAEIYGSKVSSDFINYQRFLAGSQRQYQDLSKQMQSLSDTSAQAKLRQQMSSINENVRHKLSDALAENSKNFFGVFLKGVQDIEIPEFDIPQSAERDSLLRVKRYYYYRTHYFDNMDLTDDRLLRTQFFTTKLDKYFTDIIPQIPDTVASEVIAIIEKTRPSKDMFKYMVSHLYNMVNESKIMGMDAALVQIAEKYYLSGDAYWAEEKFVTDLKETITKIKFTLIGNNAVDLKMVSPNGEWFRLSEISAPYTILVFWEPSCGHCKKEIPQLKTDVWDKYKSKGLKIFAVYCQTEKKEWTDFIDEHQLDEWINVYDPYHRTGFRTYYNINSTPQFFVLDKEKNIVAKKIGVEQMGQFLDYLMTKEEAKK